MEPTLRIRTAIYDVFSREARRPEPEEIAAAVDRPVSEVLEAYRELRANRVLVLEPDGRSIRMAPPFSGVPTQHVATVDGKRYFANCAWDVFGIVAALKKAGSIRSRCEQSGDRLDLDVTAAGPAPSDYWFHCPVPAAQWWDDIVFT